jgi:hypothetical protein
MITVHLQGGLGNQIFQYAAALAVRREVGHTIWFTEGENAHNTLKRDYVSDLFVEGRRHHASPPEAIAVYKQYSAFEPWTPTWFSSAATIYLEGYFQSLPELVPILPELRASFLPALRRSTGIHVDSSLAETGFVHVRRGDYLLNPTYHWVQPAEYYEKGMSMVTAKKWLVFSDDIQWCREQTCFQRGDVVLCDEPNELIALDVMSSCGAGAVISNSSFSWWAAMLGGLDKVVYPDLWSEYHRPDLFPGTWTRVSSSSPP